MNTMNDTETDPRAELAALFSSLNLSATIARGSLTKDADGWQHWPFTVILKYKCQGPSDSIRLHWKQGVALTEFPDAAEVLATCCRDWLDAQTSFEDWAQAYGYDEDSRKAERTWKQCRACLPDGFLSRETREKLAELAAQL